ncbi:MAG TPA: PQQ-dependent dehydrogenase, methanol/ethanol family [Acidobacteria bacterium]|nr:PQQ-dependent dehydrogenase, methanol/ethanol family [Acidobacteriota bacterium]
MTQRQILLPTLFLMVGALTAAPHAQTSSQETPPFAPVSAERLLNAEDEPENWLMYSGNYKSQRYTRLDQINQGNAADLQIQWVHQLRVLDQAETTPLVVDGVMYITESPSTVIAVEAATGRPYWRYEHQLPDDMVFCCGRNNRGVAVQGDRVIMSTLDAKLVALDARTGSVMWETQAAETTSGYSKTAAPLIVGDKIFSGVAGGEYGIRGFVDAYDINSGEREWRFFTTPGPDNPDVQTWSGDSWRRGGSATWMTGSYDPELNLVYWGTGNPGPDYDGTVRMGDNLYSDSVVALDADTGEMKWYFQFTPHDIHDWDATQIPILADTMFDGEMRKLMLFPNRNAFFYVLDRETGEFLLGTPYAKQTWAEGLDSNGRPILVPGMEPSLEGTVVSPAITGGSNWWSPSYSPRTDLLYVMAYDAETRYFIRKTAYEEGDSYRAGGGVSPESPESYHRAVRALSPQTGEVRWEFPVNPRSTSGLMATAGDLVFGGTADGFFFALDAESGEELWHKSVGGRVHSAPMAYAVDGKQHVAIAAGNAVFSFALPD